MSKPIGPMRSSLLLFSPVWSNLAWSDLERSSLANSFRLSLIILLIQWMSTACFNSCRGKIRFLGVTFNVGEYEESPSRHHRWEEEAEAMTDVQV